MTFEQRVHQDDVGSLKAILFMVALLLVLGCLMARCGVEHLTPEPVMQGPVKFDRARGL